MGGLLFTIHRTSTYRQRRNTRHKAIKHCHFGRGHLAIDSLTILGGKKNLFSIDADRVKEINRYADFLANLLSSWDTSKKRLQSPVSNSLVNWFRADHDSDPSGKSLCAQIQQALNMVNHDLLISKSLLLGNTQNPAPSPFPKLLKDIVDC